ncbi:MAG: CDGSH iron-sulfur domain-containing protein [Candidatus Woesearchaeota archaeon]|jgi:CDGSH-type Zn-finger protein
MKKSIKNKIPKILIAENGPYEVSGNIPLIEEVIVFNKDDEPLRWMKIKKYPLIESYALCRCGQSKNMPYCDGVHSKFNFDGTETASKEKYLKNAQKFVGKDLILTDLNELCSGAGFCKRAGGIWERVQYGTVKKSKNIAIKEAGCCNSGRLVVWNKKTKKAIEPKFKPTISVMKNGPLWVKGNIPIGNYEIRNRVSLCSCGKSDNKPFCDTSHFY